jgi:hypothetical protein
METMDQMVGASKPDQTEGGMVLTTLYELIEVLNQEVHPEEDWIVTDAVMDLFKSGRARFLKKQIIDKRNRSGSTGRRNGHYADSQTCLIGYCICPKCKERVPHKLGPRFLDIRCPRCGTQMTWEKTLGVSEMTTLGIMRDAIGVF